MEKSHVYGKGIYYQIWDGDQAVINYSETGLGYFGEYQRLDGSPVHSSTGFPDRVVASAKRHNLKLIVVL